LGSDSIVMLLPSDSVGEDIMFLVHPSTTFILLFVRPFIRSSGQILLPRYLMNGLSNLYENYTKYALAPADDLNRS